MIALAVAGIAVGVMSEILVGSIEAASESVGLSEFFIGVIVVAIVGNAAEHWVAVLVAIKDKMDLVGQHRDRLQRPDRAVRGAGPGAALLRDRARRRCRWSSTASRSPPCSSASWSPTQVTNEGESTWFEGVQLLALYAILGLTFYFA